MRASNDSSIDSGAAGCTSGAGHAFPDSIAISGISASGRHGVTEEERSTMQPLLIDLVLHADLSCPARSDNLGDTIDYSALHRKVVEIVETRTFKLLERLADAIIEEILSDERVLFARVDVSKPGKLQGATPTVKIGRINKHASDTAPHAVSHKI